MLDISDIKGLQADIIQSDMCAINITKKMIM